MSARTPDRFLHMEVVHDVLRAESCLKGGGTSQVVARSSRAFDVLSILRVIRRDVKPRDASAAMDHSFRAGSW